MSMVPSHVSGDAVRVGTEPGCSLWGPLPVYSSFLPSFLPSYSSGADLFHLDLPQAPGLLPKWQLIVAVSAFFNAAQNFVTLNLTRRIYSAAPSQVTPLHARTFAIWTLTSGIVRTYAAYHINNKIVYDIAVWSYLLAFGHFSSELLIFRTISTIRGPVVTTIIVSTISLIWMLAQYDFYVQKA